MRSGNAMELGACRRRLHRVFSRTATVSLVALLAATALPAIPAQATDAGIRKVGRLDRHSGLDSIAANGNLLVEPKARRGWQGVLREGQMLLFEVNLDTLALLSTTKIPEVMPAVTSLGPVEWQWTLDPKGRRIFAVTRAIDPRTRLDAHTLTTIDLRTRLATTSGLLWPGSTRFPLAISYHQPSDRLYLLARANADVAGRTHLWVEEHSIDGARLWEHSSSGCYSAMDMQYAPVLARSVLKPASMYLSCYGPGNVQAQVVRLTLGADGLPAREEVFPAVPGPLSAQFDPGSDRLFFLTTNGGAGRGAWVFDGLRSSFLGVIASGDSRAGASDYAMGLDPVTGRLYMQSPAGFLVADARRSPLPAGLLFRELAGQVIGSIQVDPVLHRAYVPDPHVKNPQGQSLQYLILEDSIRISRNPAPGDPDSLTLNTPEKKGITDANYSGGARAFALRTLTTGGVQRMAWNLAIGQFSPEDRGFSQVDGAIHAVPLDPSNRDVYAARVQQVSFNNESADAAATFAETDAGTLRDFKSIGQPFPVTGSECHDEGDKAISAQGTGSAVSCNQEAEAVMATSALNGAASEPGTMVSTRSLLAYGAVQRDPHDGLAASAVSIVRDLTIGGRVWIGEVRAEAQTRAKGRPGTAAATFTRYIEGVRVDTDGDGKADFRCGACDPGVVKRAVEQALPGQVSIEFPQPNPTDFGKGSPGGYQAIVQKETFRGFAERSLNDDDSPEVPAMQIVLYADARAGRSRQIIQVAGVQAESHYGIYLLPQGDGLPAPEPSINTNPRPATAVGPTVVLTRKIAVATPPAPRTFIERVLRRIATGFGLLPPKGRDSVLLAVLWIFLMLPAYLVARRRKIA